MFCSINIPSGLPLSKMDYYRARICGKFRNQYDGRSSTSALRVWSDIEYKLGGAEMMQRFLVHFCCVKLYSTQSGDSEDRRLNIENAFHYRETISEYTVQSMMERYLQNAKLETIMDDLSNYSLIFREVTSTNQYRVFPNKAQNHSLQLLRYISAQKERRSCDLWITLALGVISLNPHAAISQKFWNQLEILFAFLLVTKKDVEQMVATCDEILRNVHKLGTINNENYDWRKVIRLSDRNAARFQSSIEGEIYSENPFGARYLLLAIEVRRQQAALLDGLEMNSISTTVEHICPQNPRQGSNWTKSPWAEWKRDGWENKFGNLALLERSHNSEVQNFDWEIKRTKYVEDRKGTYNLVLFLSLYLKT
ncbi:hypothetical protein BKA69DRAFT_606765 [Paraphysoderma sedebokerense]|nr:hypothetical protein BKA69DRAFT_606765 [Paraphysoderma sedebokerense]